jgi:uncharacterized protein YbjT (DUF2867 family)
VSRKAIVIGATGLVGRALVDQLTEAQDIDQIVTLTRRAAEHASAKVTNYVVDFDRLEQYADLFRGELLFSCLGTTLKQAGSLAAQRRVDFDYQYRAAQLAAKNGVNHYLLVSSSGADARSRSPYLKMKGDLEIRVRSFPFERITILQPSLLVGERDEPRSAETLGLKILPWICKLPWFKAYRPIAGSLVAAKLLQASRGHGEQCQCFRLDEVFPH